jgi:RNA polymerase sigma factor (sigma-70 family)
LEGNERMVGAETAGKHVEAVAPIVGSRDATILDRIPQLMPRLYGYARYRMTREDAEEAVGSALEQIWRRRRHWSETRGPVEAWMITVGINAIRDEARRQRRHRSEGPLLESELLAADDHATAVVELEALRNAIASLGPSDSHLIALRFGAELSHGEIGDLLSMQPGAVAVAIHRAIGRLRKKLDDK